ncbi:MAG: NAD-dependent epimerase/dehydratase family protein [Anaerolineae bacterium]|jgi:nucleoside-diphosphate-sugar epimerase|nr:NAD-dependent epimerase/dehydratase family protein [Anaerolineae bacterium]
MSQSENRYLVTGAMGCLGAWTLYHLFHQGKYAVSFDLSADRARLNLLLSTREQAALTFVQGDLTAADSLLETLRTHRITHIIHLAALQVPFCRASPVRGAQVNVVGTVNVFEAARVAGIRHLAYASSIAVYGPAGDYPPGPIRQDAPFAPRTLYGVYKVADEGIARVYWQDHQLSSTALRPYTIYGVGRDQGLTAGPTQAILAAAAGRPFHISFGGVMQFQLASDAALQFITAAEQAAPGALVFNLGGPPTTVAALAHMLQQLRPQAQVTVGEAHLPFPEAFDDTALRQHATTLYETPLADGIAQTLAHFERHLSTGLLHVQSQE